jgi:hypothetical protein
VFFKVAIDSDIGLKRICNARGLKKDAHNFEKGLTTPLAACVLADMLRFNRIWSKNASTSEFPIELGWRLL